MGVRMLLNAPSFYCKATGAGPEATIAHEHLIHDKELPFPASSLQGQEWKGLFSPNCFLLNIPILFQWSNSDGKSAFYFSK